MAVGAVLGWHSPSGLPFDLMMAYPHPPIKHFMHLGICPGLVTAGPG
jgi:hypothetical protein